MRDLWSEERIDLELVGFERCLGDRHEFLAIKRAERLIAIFKLWYRDQLVHLLRLFIQIMEELAREERRIQCQDEAEFRLGAVECCMDAAQRSAVRVYVTH